MTSVVAYGVTCEVEGEGGAIVFVHGLGGSSNAFQTLMGAAEGWRCIRPDLPGAARSPRPYEVISIEGLVKSVAGLLRLLGGAPALFVGHSMGGLLCQHLAAGAPELVRAMLLFGPVMDPSDEARARLKERARNARTQGMQAVADAVCAATLSSAARAHNPTAAAFVRESHMRQEAEGFAQHCEALAAAKGVDLKALRLPVMIVTGDEDPVCPPSQARLMGDRIAGAKVRLLNQCGHWPMIERPAESNAALKDFLSANAV